jgi:nucleoside-diphosphate-sugar epimerase
MKVLVFGGAGFIGCVLVEKLLELGHIIYVVDNFRKGINSIIQYKPNDNLYIEYGDIRDINDVKNHVVNKKPDYVVLLSGIVGLSDCDGNPQETYDVNVTGWENVAKICKDLPVIGVSTGSVYGKIEDGVCTEETPTNACSIYGETKLKGEKPVLDIQGVILRYATAGGKSKNMRYNLLPNELTKDALVKGILSIFQPDVKRTFIDIRDFANSIVFTIKNYDKMKGQIYNVGDEDNNWTKRQLVEYIKEKTRCVVLYNEDREDQDQRNYFCKYDKIKSLGFKCEYSVKDIIDDLLSYYRYEVE